MIHCGRKKYYRKIMKKYNSQNSRQFINFLLFVSLFAFHTPTQVFGKETQPALIEVQALIKRAVDARKRVIAIGKTVETTLEAIKIQPPSPERDKQIEEVRNRARAVVKKTKQPLKKAKSALHQAKENVREYEAKRDIFFAKKMQALNDEDRALAEADLKKLSPILIALRNTVSLAHSAKARALDTVQWALSVSKQAQAIPLSQVSSSSCEQAISGKSVK